jgi:hypothetical protein
VTSLTEAPDEAPLLVPTPTRDEAILALAKALFWKMEHLDPTTDFDHERTLDENWAALEGPIKSIYRQSVLWIIAHDDLVRAALSRSARPPERDKSGLADCGDVRKDESERR